MKREAFIPLEPSLDCWRLVSGIIVENEVHIQFSRDISVDLIEELLEFLRPVPLVAVSYDLSGGNIQGSEQCGGS